MQGIQQGIEKGLRQKQHQIAKTMLEKKIDINIISEIVGQTITELKNL